MNHQKLFPITQKHVSFQIERVCQMLSTTNETHTHKHTQNTLSLRHFKALKKITKNLKVSFNDEEIRLAPHQQHWILEGNIAISFEILKHDFLT